MEAPVPPELEIKNHYKKAFECLDTGLLEDEVGDKGRAVVLYRLGRRHLLQGLEVTTHGERCVGPEWDSARQMQLKMNEALSSITTRLAVLETALNPGASGSTALYPSLPVLEAPCRPARRPCFNSQRSPTATGGVPYMPASPSMASDVPTELPPAYTPQPTNGHLTLSHSKGKDWPSRPRPKLMSRHQSLNEGGEDLLFLSRGVQMFFVTADGQVSAPSYPGYLRIILNSCRRYEMDDISDIRQPPAYLQVCDWHYPLFPDSPVLLSNTGVFTFPDTTAARPGSYVGVVLSSELPEADRALFQEHLSVLTQLRVQAADEEEAAEPIERGPINLNEKTPIGPSDGTTTEQDTSSGKEEKTLPEWSEKMSHGILTGASWLSRGLVQGAEATGKVIQKGATKLREHITPEETPAEVNPRVTRGLYVAKQATGGAAKVSHFLVDGLSTVVERVGKELAPHVKKHGSKLIPESLKKNKDASTNMDGAKVVAVSSFKGLSTIWSGLETAAKTVGKSASSETVLTVKHKYGHDVGQATDTAVQSVVNVGVTALNMDKIALKAVLKGAGRQTSKSINGEEKTSEPEKMDERKEDEEK